MDKLQEILDNWEEDNILILDKEYTQWLEKLENEGLEYYYGDLDD